MPFLNVKVSNNGASTLEAGISAGIWTLILATGTRGLFPSTFPFFLTVEKFNASLQVTKREIVKVTAGATEALTITRSAGYCPADYTATTLTNTAFSFDAGDSVKLKFVAEIIEDLTNEIVRLENDKANQSDVDVLTNTYAAASGGTDTYAFTIPDFPGYVAAVGKTYKFLADVPNTWASGVNINWNGVIPMYKGFDNDTVTGDIKANQIITIVIGAGGTSVQMTSQVDTIVDLSSYATRTKTYTISGGTIAGDVLYPSAADTAKKIYPSDVATVFGSATSCATSPTSFAQPKCLPLSNGLILYVSGWDGGNTATLKAQVRTINAAETDFTNGSEVNLLSSPSVYWFDVCEIDTNKFMAIYAKNTSSDIGTVVFTISGTTITVWTEQIIESANTATWKVSIAKVDTNKALICYRKTSDNKPYVQVLTVSGTTITTNTPVLLKNTSNAMKTASAQITTNQIMVVYGDSASSIFAVTVNVSGTTPTVNTETTVTNIGTGSNSVEVKRISDTKLVCVTETWSANELALKILTLSGAWNNTISAGAATTITGAWVGSSYRAIYVIGTEYLLFSSYRSTPTDMYLRYYSIGATTTTLISTQTSPAVSSATYPSVALVKVAPWTYYIIGTAANSDFIIKLTPNSSARLWVAQGTIADGATGEIAKRFHNATLSALTVWAKYYADDNGNITVNSSLTAPEIGYADSTTNLILV